MRGLLNIRLGCPDHERLEEELLETRTRGQNLSRLRRLTPLERAALDQRERAVLIRLRDHEAEHGCRR